MLAPMTAQSRSKGLSILYAASPIREITLSVTLPHLVTAQLRIGAIPSKVGVR